MTDVLGLTKATLLIAPETDKIFKPWCTIGFDDTTLLHMRVRQNDITFPQKKYLLNNPAALELSHFFSSKDYGTIDTLMVLPIYYGQKLSGILFVADNPYLTLSSSECDMIFLPIQDLLRQLIEGHLELCRIPPQLEPINCADIARKSELRMEMLDQRNLGQILDFSYNECISYLLKEYPYLVPEAANTDLRLRLLSNLQFYVRHSFYSPDHYFIWLSNEAVVDIPALIKLCAVDLSFSMISAADYAANIELFLRSISMNSFLHDYLTVVTA